MAINKIKVFVITSTLFFLNGCTTLHGQLTSITKTNTSVGCRIDLRYKNLSPQYKVAPIVEYIVFDSELNTIEESTFFFDSIQPNKYQEKFTYTHGSCDKVQRLDVNKAYDNYSKLPLKGVTKTYNW